MSGMEGSNPTGAALKLKSMTEDEEKGLSLLMQVSKALGWPAIAFDSKQDPVRGLVIGTEEYVDEILSHLPNKNEDKNENSECTSKEKH